MESRAQLRASAAHLNNVINYNPTSKLFPLRRIRPCVRQSPKDKLTTKRINKATNRRCCVKITVGTYKTSGQKRK
ncbi:unnamed protein product [Dicrocoelium dendriticum]|nr:unnamed protein product [Dicrocoelium dendriticum]